MSGNDLDPPDPGENPAPESDGGQPSHINIDGSEGDISGQSDQPEAISCSLEGHGTVRGATEGSSDDPEGFQASVTVDPANSDGRWSAGNDIVPSADTESSIGAEGYPEGQCYESPNGIADTAANGPMGNDLEDEGLQDPDNDQTEDSLEGGLPYREGELVGGIQDSLSVHNYFESEGQNAEAENAEEDRGLFAGDEMPSWAAEDTASSAVEEECVEADNLQNDNEARLFLESSAADENEIQENRLVVQADILHVPDGQHKPEESLSESDPEENASVETFCNDSVEADASQNVPVLQENSGTADPEHELRVNVLVSYGESSTENPSGQLETEQNESLQREIGTENSVLLGSGASGSIPALRSSIDDVQSVSSEISAGGENHENASFLGDTAHRTENSVCLGSGDEPEDSVSVEAAAILRNPASVDPDLCAPECDRPQTGSSPTVSSEGRDSSELAEGGGDGCSVNSSVNDSECAHAGQAENRVTESVGDNVQGDSSHNSLDSLRLSSQVSQNGPENISVPPCQQATGLLELEQVELPSRCPGISGADLGDDFPRSADMLQSLTEGRDGFIDKAENSGDDCVILSTIKSETSANRDQIDALSSTLHQRTLQGNETAYPEPNKEQATCFSAPHSVVEPEHSNSNNSSSEGREHSVLSGDSGIVMTDKVTLKSSVVIKSDAAISVDDDLLSELDAELEPKSSKDNASSSGDIPEHTPHGPLNGMTVKPALCEISEGKLRILLTDLQSQMSEKESIIAKLENERSLHSEKLQYALYERDTYLKQLNSAKSKQQADDLYLPQIKELEYTINKQQNEIRGLKDKLSSHDASAKKVVGSMQNELKVRVDQVTKMYEECRKEKDSMVMKYAQAEHKNIELQKATEKAEGRLREILREREMFLTKAKQLKADYQRTCSELETKCSELALASKELDKHRELVTSSEVRIKWAQNKMKAELDAHKETKKELEKINFRLKEAKEETEQIRRDTQAIVKTYQESEEMKSISLDQRLKKKETELLLEKREKTDQSEVHQAVMKELETLKVQYKDNLEELNTYKDKVRAQEAERLTNEETMTKYKDVLQTQKRENRELQAKIDKMFHVQSDFDRAQDTIKSLDADIRDLKLSNKELQAELESCRKRESELLHLTKKLTEKNAHLQSENTIISGQMMNLNSDNQRKDMELQEFETKLRNASDSLEEEIKSRRLETEKLTESLKKKTKQTEDLSRQVDEQKDEIRTLKRRHANNIKDLTRQLQQARRKLENLEKGEKETVSMGSRTSSNGSLNTPQGDVNGVQTSVVPRVNVQPESPPQEYPVIVEQVEIDREVLVNRIVKLQKAHARKNEKIEFMEDHINQLLAEVKKKKRIIQNYVMREEAGALSTENMDLNKMELSKRGGIMASVYSSHAADSHMNLELSLEINKKLQSVLEDTLLKNITLKENIDTLGEEIARLSQENRRLQLSIQGL